MEEERVSLGKAIASSIVVGIYVGLAGSTFSVLSDPMNLERHGNILLYATILCGLFLTPFLWKKKIVRGDRMEINLSELSTILSKYGEGRGRWRFLSHVRDEKVRLAIDLRNSSHSMEILERTLHLYANHPVRYIVGHSSDEQQKLRTNVLSRLKEIESESFEIKSFSKSIEVCALESDKVRNRRRNITFIVITGLILFSIQFILDTWL